MKRSLMSLSNTKLLSGNMGKLIPCGLTEILPGDTIQQATSCFIRFSPLMSPVMHPTHIQLAHWFVPHRLVWEDWEDFITGGEDGDDASVFPTINFPSGGPEINTLADYLGVPTDIVQTGGTDVSALPFRGYSLIWNEWYRDQDLEDKLVIDKTSGADTTTNTLLQNAAWEKDYFTSARPWEAKGPQITIPIGSSAPLSATSANIKGLGYNSNLDAIGAENNVRETGSGTVNYANALTANLGAPNDLVVRTDGNTATARPVITADLTGITADLSGASAVTINLLREALALQRFEEARARFGSRYVEYLRYLGVRSSDARLQRPEFLGGGRYPVQFSEVLQTAEGTDPVGELRGHGIGFSRSNRFRRFFEEHGYVFTFMVVKPKTIYAQGLFRHWNRRTKEDFFQKELQHIGQQEVLNKEVYAAHPTPNGVFGYQDRYDEYRRAESSIAGEFRTVLDFWHFARQFGSPPALNDDFIRCEPSTEPFAVPSQNVLYAQVRHSIQARRLVASSGNSFIF